jgi:hypothetical protein
MGSARFTETTCWLIYGDLEESTKLKYYPTSDFSIKLVIEPIILDLKGLNS